MLVGTDGRDLSRVFMNIRGVLEFINVANDFRQSCLILSMLNVYVQLYIARCLNETRDVHISFC